MTGTAWMWFATMGYAQDDELVWPDEAQGASRPTGDYVDVETQRRLGLVTVVGSEQTCTGTLVNQYWVLTTLIGCVPELGASIRIEASWSSERPVATKVVGFPGDPDTYDTNMALIFLGDGDFGPVDSHLFFVGSVEDGLQVRTYGRGYTTLARLEPPAVGATRDGSFRTGLFVAEQWEASTFWLPENEFGQIVAGDEGGPAFVEYDGVALGIAGVAAHCINRFSWDIPDDPTSDWTFGFFGCWIRQIEPVRHDLLATIQEVPVHADPGILDSAIDTTYTGGTPAAAQPTHGTTTYTGGTAAAAVRP